MDAGGEATLARVAELEGMPYAALVSLFNDARIISSTNVDAAGRSQKQPFLGTLVE